MSLIRTCQELVDEDSFEKEVVEIGVEVDRCRLRRFENEQDDSGSMTYW